MTVPHMMPAIAQSFRPQLTLGKGHELAIGGNGKGKPGDWNCPNPECKNHTENFVFASKDACPLCGTPKPAETFLHFVQPVAQPRVVYTPPPQLPMGKGFNTPPP